ncbi:MAG: hypothetical protein Q9224_004800, partial [Gallowayella concinna]
SLHRSWTTNAILFSFVFDLFGGGEVMRITIITTCIAQITPPEKLTNVYNYISGIYLLASVSGAAIGSLLLSRHVHMLNALSMLCYVFAASVAATIPTESERELEATEDSQPMLLGADHAHSPPLKSLTSALALFSLPSLRRRYLEPRMSTEQVDLFITQMSLVANAVGMVCLGFSASAPFFILSLCLYTSGVGLADSLTSYGTSTLPAGEQIGDFY